MTGSDSAGCRGCCQCGSLGNFLSNRGIVTCLHHSELFRAPGLVEFLSHSKVCSETAGIWSSEGLLFYLLKLSKITTSSDTFGADTGLGGQGDAVPAMVTRLHITPANAKTSVSLQVKTRQVWFFFDHHCSKNCVIESDARFPPQGAVSVLKLLKTRLTCGKLMT